MVHQERPDLHQKKEEEKTPYQSKRDEIYETLSRTNPNMEKKELNKLVTSSMKLLPNRKELLKQSRGKKEKTKRVKTQYQMYKEQIAEELIKKTPGLKKSMALSMAKNQIESTPTLLNSLKAKNPSKSKPNTPKTPRTPRTTKIQSIDDQVTNFNNLVANLMKGKTRVDEKQYGLNVSHYDGITHFGRKAEIKAYKDTIIAEAGGMTFPLLVNQKGYGNFSKYLAMVVSKSNYARYADDLDRSVKQKLKIDLLNKI